MTTIAALSRSTILVSVLLVGCASAQAGVLLGGGLFNGYRWDAAAGPRSLFDGLQYSVIGGSYQAFRDQFQWNTVPSTASFQKAVEDAFNAWTVVDPATGLGTNLHFVADLSTTVVGGNSFGGINPLGAEIDLLAKNAGDSATRGSTNFNYTNDFLTLTSGTTNYQGAIIKAVDISLNNNSGAVYSLDFFRRLLTHEIGHAIGLGDAEASINPFAFRDDNYDGSTGATAAATLNNSWALLVNVDDPAFSPLGIYNVSDNSPGLASAGVNLLMESRGLGIGPGNPVTNLTPLTNDEFGMRQYLYPWRAPEPQAAVLLALAGIAVPVAGRRRITLPR